MDKRFNELEKIGTELIIKSFIESAPRFYSMNMGFYMENCKTPIERYFLLGCLTNSYVLNPDSVFNDDLCIFDGNAINFDRAMKSKYESVKDNHVGEFIIVCQHKIDKYIADFVFLYIFYDSLSEQIEEIKVVVECDGHDFHEKTKEQAQHDKERDRRFIDLGYIVLRFTGSEIYKDPFKCASEPHRLIDKIWKAHFKKRSILKNKFNK